MKKLICAMALYSWLSAASNTRKAETVGQMSVALSAE